MRSIHVISGLILLAIALSACNLPAPTSPTPSEPDAAYTVAAQTIIARLTEVARTLTPTVGITAALPSPTKPAELEQTATPALETTEAPTELPPTDTVTPLPPTEAPTATPTFPTGDPRLSLGEPDFYDNFATSANWPLYEDDHVSFRINNQTQLIMTAFNPDQWDGWMLTSPVITDFYLEMTARFRQCSGIDRYGLVFRAVPSENGYIGYHYGVSCDGRFSLRRWDGKNFIKLIDWTESDNINAGSQQGNRIGVMANGNRFSLYANGVLLREFSDDTHSSGRFGVFVGSVNTPNFKVEVEEVSQWELP